MPEKSLLVPIITSKGDVQNCSNYRCIKSFSDDMGEVETKMRSESQQG